MPQYGPGSHEWLAAHPGYAGGAFSGGGGGGENGASMDFSSYAQDDPRMLEAYNILKGRMDTSNTKRAIDKAVLGTMDAAALGAKDLGANMARRGVSGTGTGATFLQKNVFAPAQREASGKAAEISLAEQDRLDKLAAALQGPAAGIAGHNLSNREFGLQSWQAMQQAALQRQQLAQSAMDNEIARWMALANSGFGGGGYGGGAFGGGAAGMPSIGMGGGGGGVGIGHV